MGQPNPFRQLEEVHNRTFIPESQRVSSTDGGSGSRGRNNFLNFLGSAGKFVGQNIVPIGLNVASFLYQQRQNKKIKRQINQLSEQNRGLEIRFTPSADEVPVCYGYSAVRGIPVYAAVSNKLPSVPGMFGNLQANPTGGNFNDYLMVQYVICAAGISRVLDIYVNGDPWASEKLSDLCSHELRQNEASPHVSAFTTERGATDIGSGYAVINGFYRFDNENSLISSIPDILVFVEGEEVKSVSSGAFSTGESFSNASPLTLANYLTSNVYGPRFSAEDLALDVWEVAIQRASVVAPVSGITDFHGIPIPQFKVNESNGLIYSPGDWIDSIFAFLQVMPGSDFWRRLDGPWGLAIPDTSGTTAKQQADALGVKITESDLLRPPKVNFPNTSVLINGKTNEYNNMFEDFSLMLKSTSTLHSDLRIED